MKLLQLIASTRTLLLFFLFPASLAWAQTEGSGGIWFVLAHTGLILAHLAIFDTKSLASGHRQRMALTRDRAACLTGITERWAIFSGGILALGIVGLLFAAPGKALAFVIAAAVVLSFTGGVGRGATPIGARQRMFLAEVLSPFWMLVLPAWYVAVGTISGEGGESLTPGLTPNAWAATWLCALTLGAYFLVCIIRDQPEDAGAGQATTATLLGRSGAILGLFALFGAAIIVSAMHTVSDAALPWLAPAIVGIGGMATIWAVAQDGDDAAPALVFLTQLGVVAALAL